jgi:hypothetical protein
VFVVHESTDVRVSVQLASSRSSASAQNERKV